METKYRQMNEILLKHIPETGNYPASIDGISLVKRDKPTKEYTKCFYKPACIFVIQGEKHVIFDNKNLIYGKGQYIVSCTEVPAASRIVKASKDSPFICLILEFKSVIISDLLLELKLSKSVDNEEKCLAIADADTELIDAFYRLVQLLDKTQMEQDILSPMIIKEIYYRLLVGPLGNQLRLINTKGTRSNHITQAIALIKENYNKKLNMEELAQKINMAPSSFYRNFKQLTSVSPLQYQKQLKLSEAQRLMLTGNYDAASACYKVGYESPTQFSREYKKMFGKPPRTYIKTLVL